MREEFRLKGKPAELARRIESEIGCLDELSSADDLNRVLDDLQRAALLECPRDLEILVYPSAVEESDVALITVVSTANANAHVVAASEEMRKLADIEVWEGKDGGARTLSIIEGAVGLANWAVAKVRQLEERAAVREVRSAVRCPKCGAEGHLRFEYLYDLLGLSRDGHLVLAEGGELSDIFCLACGEEVDDVLGPEGPVLAGDGGEGSA